MRGLLKGTATCCAAAIACAAVADAQQFTPRAPIEAPGTAASAARALVAFAPLDADAAPDLAIGVGATTTVRGLAGPAFSTQLFSQPLALGNAPFAMSPAPNGQVAVDDGGKFVSLVSSGPKQSQRAVDAADPRDVTDVVAGNFDADAATEVIAAGNAINGLLRCNSVTSPPTDTPCTPQSDTPATPDGEQIAAGDADADGRLDVLSVGGDALVLLRNTGTTFTVTGTSTAGARPGATGPALVDVTGDGKLDAVALLLASGLVAVAPGNGAGGLAATKTSPAGVTGTTGGLAAADFDRDGKIDVAVGSDTTGGQVRVLRGKGDGTFEAPVAVPLAAGGARAATGIGELSAGDYDSDGRPDLAVASNGGQRVDLLRNTTPVPPLATTSAPAKLGITTTTVAGKVDLRGFSGTARFEYGTSTAYGSATPEQPLTGPPGERDVTAELTELQPNTTYHVRVIATTTNGTTAGQDVAFTTGDPGPTDTTVVAALADQALSGAPVAVFASATGDNGPFTYAWDFGDGTTAPAGADDPVVHRFPVQAAHAGEGARAPKLQDSRRSSYRVTVVAYDKFGRASVPAVSKPITILPNHAPKAALRADVTPLEYTEKNQVRSVSRDPDAPEDHIARQRWAFASRGGTKVVEEDVPEAGGDCKPLGAKPGVNVSAYACLPGLGVTAQQVKPWRDDRKGVEPISQYDPFPGTSLVPGEAEHRSAAAALRKYVQQQCGAASCWPNRDKQPTDLTVTDESGESDTVHVDLPVRVRTRPAADVELVIPGAATQVASGSQQAGNSELPGAIYADDPVSGPGTKLKFDASKSTADGGEDPVWYVLEIGTPWQESCATGNKDKHLEVPQTAPPFGPPIPGGDPIDQGQLSQGELVGGGAKGDVAVQKGAALRATAAAKKKKGGAKTTTGGSPGSPLSGGKAKSPKSSLTKAECKKDFGVNDTIRTLVTKDPEQLVTTIPQAGTWSALLTVYDRIGGTSKQRLDGIETKAGSATCVNQAASVGGKDGIAKLAFTGTCVSNAKGLYWTPQPIDLNGLRLAPTGSSFLVLDNRNPAAFKLYASSSAPKDDSWKQPGNLQSVELLAQDTPIARFTPEQDVKFASADGFFAKALDVEYGGLPLASVVEVGLGRTAATRGSSTVTFQQVLPKAFGNNGGSGGPTGTIVLKGFNAGSSTVVKKTTEKDAGVAKARAAKARAARVRRSRARLAQSSLLPPKLELDSDTDLGGLSLPGGVSGLKFTYDRETRTFSGSAKASLMGAPTTVRVVIRDGEFEEASGTVSLTPGIALGTSGAFITQLTFRVQAQPDLILTGSATINEAGLLAATGQLRLGFAPFNVRLDGTLKLADLLPLGSAYIEYGNGLLGMGGSVGYDFGPASFNAGVTGVFGASGFNVEGSGNACFFLCLGVDALLSSDGLAACGDIDLWLTSIQPGFGYRYKTNDLDLFGDGCDVSPYKANVVRGVGRPGDLSPVLGAGQSKTFDITDAGLPSINVLVQAAGNAGVAPRVTLVSPDKKVYATPAVLGDYQFMGPALGAAVDVDPLSQTTRFLIAKPAKGTWTLTVDPGSVGIGSVDLARGLGPLTRKAFTTTQVSRLEKSDLGRSVQGTVTGQVVTKKQARAAAVGTPGPVTAAKTTLQQGTAQKPARYGKAMLPRLRELSVKGTLPGGSRVTFIESGPKTAQQLATATVPKNAKLSTSFTFMPGASADGKRSIDAFVTTADGVPRGLIKGLDSYDAPPVPKPAPGKVTGFTKQKGHLYALLSAGPDLGKASLLPETRVVGTTKGGIRIEHDLAGRDYVKVGKTWAIDLGSIDKGDGLKLTLSGIDVTRGNALAAGRRVKTYG